jgi:hypothetical protein
MGTMTPEEVRVVFTAMVLLAVLMTTHLTTAIAGAATLF